MFNYICIICTCCISLGAGTECVPWPQIFHILSMGLYEWLECKLVDVGLEGPHWDASKLGQFVRTKSGQQGCRFRERLGLNPGSSPNAHPYHTNQHLRNFDDWWSSNMNHYFPSCLHDSESFETLIAFDCLWHLFTHVQATQPIFDNALVCPHQSIDEKL